MEVEGDSAGAGVQASEEDSGKEDQGAWAQCLLEGSYFESCFSPISVFSGSPKGDLQGGAGGFPELGVFCPSPLLSDQLKILHSWSSRVAKHADDESGSTSVNDGESTEPCMSIELDKVGTKECGDGDEDKKGRKRKSASEGEDEGSLSEKRTSSLKKVKAKVKVKGPKKMREPRYAIKTRSVVDIMEDGYKWRKYGQKPVKNSPHPRNYYRCTTANCPVRKRVERDTEDTSLVITSYEGTHSHPKVTRPKNSSVRSSNNCEHDLDPLDPLGRPGAWSTDLVPPFPAVPNLTHIWGSPLNCPGWPPQQAPSVHDNMGLVMAYQLVRLQWELQARTQQLMDFNTQPAVAQGPAFSDPEAMTNSSNCVDSEPQQHGRRVPKPGSSLGSSLLRKRASAFSSGGPFPLDLQNVGKMQGTTPNCST